MFGAGHGKAGAVGREMQTLPGKPGTPLNGARRLGGLGATHIILGTLALEVVSKCELFHSTIGRQELGEGDAGAWSEGEG